MDEIQSPNEIANSGQIKSSLEIAAEKIKNLQPPSADERLKWKYEPEGAKLAVKFLKGEEVSLIAELSKFDDNARKYVSAEAAQIMVRRLALPRDENTKKSNKRVMDGIKELKKDKVAVENVYSKMRRIFTHFSEDGERQKAQAYQMLKKDLDAKLQEAAKQQMNYEQTKMPVENTPQFMVEWRKLLARLDAPYLQYLEEFKQQLLDIP
jgi:hypothetical protein